MTKTELNRYLNEISEAVSSADDIKGLRAQSESVRDRYRNKDAKGRDLEIRDAGEARAYLAWRWPVTAMVIHEVLGRLLEVWPEFSPQSVLDLGAGPAVSVLPASLLFPELGQVTLMEEQPAMMEAGDLMLKQIRSSLSSALTIRWHQADFLKEELPAADLILASYAANELSFAESQRFCEALKGSSARAIVLIVPGTPEHFEGLTSIRNRLVADGFSILAPCTFTGPCPMEGEADWCHFYLRVQRSRLLRQLKNGDLSYEDEKFSYLILGRDGVPADSKPVPDPKGPVRARIIRHPIISKGYRQVTLCHRDGITMTRFTKGRHQEIYRQLKRKGWGDLLEVPVSSQDGE